jgi:pimeloyl-ACP methyl ester carboxylesterase
MRAADGTEPGSGHDFTLVLPSRRTLSWAEYGDSTGRPLVALHGTPGSRRQVSGAHELAAAAGVRLIAPDRPGFGLSSPDPGLSFTSFAEDLGHLLDHLALGRVTIVAVSGGGGFGLAAAAGLPERVGRLVMICAMVPNAPKATLRGQHGRTRLMMSLAKHAPGLVEKLMSRASAAADPDGAKLEKALLQLCDADQAVLRDPQVRADSAADSAEAFRQGPRAAVRELALYRSPVQYRLTDITSPVSIVHGTADQAVPAAVARWLGAQLPHAEQVDVVEGGHLIFASHPALVFDRVL